MHPEVKAAAGSQSGISFNTPPTPDWARREGQYAPKLSTTSPAVMISLQKNLYFNKKGKTWKLWK
jgi:hypothetical protein